MNAEQRRQLAIEIAKMYYIDRLSQNEIAQATGMSRSNISRILNKCVEEGIVEIHVNDTLSSRPEVAQRLKVRFGLREVIVVPTQSSARKTAKNAGASLATYLMRTLKSGMLLGVSKGAALYYTARQLDNRQNLQVDVVQLMGGTTDHAVPEEGQALASHFASKLGGKAFILNAPLMVKSKLTKQMLLQDAMISQVAQRHGEVSVNLFEIEIPYVHAGDHFRQPWLTRADALQLSEVGVASFVCGYYYNPAGLPCYAGIHDRVLAIDPDALAACELNIGVALGRKSLEAVLSVIRSGMMHVLVVDEELALTLQSDYEEPGTEQFLKKILEQGKREDN